MDTSTMQIASANVWGLALSTTLLLLGSCVPAERENFDVSSRALSCFGLEHGYGVPLCVTSLTRIIANPDLFTGRYVAVSGVISIEFDSCVLHRDQFSSDQQIDMESLIIDDPSCPAQAREILGSNQAAVVDVVGKYDSVSGNDNIVRSGKLSDMKLLGPRVLVGR